MTIAWVLVTAIWLGGCGRIAFDATSDGSAQGDQAIPGDALALLEGCIAHFAMDEANWFGNADEVVNGCGGLSGRAVGGASVVTDPLRGRVGSFIGDPSCVEVGDAPALRASEQLTMSAWIYPLGLDGTTPFGIVSKRVGYQVDSAYTLFLWTGNTPWVDIDSENDRFGTAAPVSGNTWSQLTVVFDGRSSPAQRVTVYRDAELELQTFESSSRIPSLTAPLMVGCMPDMQRSQVSFVGRLDEVAIWPRALSASEVRDWYQATRR